ncbi:MAG: ribonuclease III [Deltaproteobacteria bacterium]|nr:ribonuclease III [Deltaproteobacteria bacterium]
MFEVERRIGYSFASRHLLEEALRHASLVEEGERENSYQRLEFLGDSVLNLCVAAEIFRRFPDAGEGELSKARSAVINNRNLVRIGQEIGVPESIRTDPSVREKGGGVTRKMVADAVEAIIGAIFLDGGFVEATRFVHTRFWDGTRERDLVAGFDAKSRLQEWCQKKKIRLPTYRVTDTAGPAHSRTFTVVAVLADGTEAMGSGATKKDAEMQAAAEMLSLVAPAED